MKPFPAARMMLPTLLLLAAPRAQEAQDPLAAACAWLAAPAAWKEPAPGADVTLSRQQVEEHLPKLLDALREGVRASGGATLRLAGAEDPGTLTVGTFTFPYVLRTKGERPATGWPLYLCLHGGGGNDKADGPHGWSVNTGEWKAQQRLVDRLYPSPGLYFVPRMADDRQGRWWFDHNQEAFDEVIRQAILFHGVDPDRVHLLGISEGGYGAIRFAGNRPDRFASCGAMAAAEPLDTSPPENMRNVSLRIDIGEKDTMFDRVGLARRMGEELAKLRAADPQGFDHMLSVQAGRGHGIDYRPCPEWQAVKVRQPHPDVVTWLVRPFHTRTALQQYWLALPAEPAAMPLHLAARLRDNQLVLEASRTGSDGKEAPATDITVLVRLADGMADLDQPIACTVNGVARQPLRVRRTLGTLVRTLAERSDPRLAFPVEVAVPLRTP